MQLNFYRLKFWLKNGGQLELWNELPVVLILENGETKLHGEKCLHSFK